MEGRTTLPALMRQGPYRGLFVARTVSQGG